MPESSQCRLISTLPPERIDERRAELRARLQAWTSTRHSITQPHVSSSCWQGYTWYQFSVEASEAIGPSEQPAGSYVGIGMMFLLVALVLAASASLLSVL